MEETVDVVIVGGGISGLCCARELQLRAPDLRVVVLEGDARVGGRLRTVTVCDCMQDEKGRGGPCELNEQRRRKQEERKNHLASR